MTPKLAASACKQSLTFTWQGRTVSVPFDDSEASEDVAARMVREIRASYRRHDWATLSVDVKTSPGPFGRSQDVFTRFKCRKCGETRATSEAWTGSSASIIDFDARPDEECPEW